MEARVVIDQARPMLEDLLPSIGVSNGQALDLSVCLDPFSTWVSEQDISPDDINFLTSLIGAFIMTYLSEYGGGEIRVRNNRIILALSLDHGVQREFEPYRVAHSIASGSGGDIVSFIHGVLA